MSTENTTVYVANIEEEAKANTDYRRVRFTSVHTQIVHMSLEPGIEIGEEIHGVDQFIMIEAGDAKAIIGKDKNEYDLQAGSAILIPAATHHNIVNLGNTPVKLYTIYAGPNHLRSTLQPTKADEVEDAFDGLTDL